MRDLFFKDLGWKLFSVFLALAIWLTVDRILREAVAPPSANSFPVTYGNLPVFVVSLAEDVHLYRVTPDSVTVEVSGSPATMAVLQANQIRVTVDLTGIAPAKNLSRPVYVSVPAGVTLVSVEPQTVSVIMPAPDKIQ